MNELIQNAKTLYSLPIGYKVIRGLSQLDMHGLRISNTHGDKKYFVCMHTECRGKQKKISIKNSTTDGLNHLRNVHHMSIDKKMTKRNQVAALHTCRRMFDFIKTTSSSFAYR